MTRRRFYAAPTAFDHKHNTVTLVADEVRHLREVLRLKAGDEVYVFNGEGKEFLGRIEESRRDTALLRIIREIEPARPDSPLQLTLALALLKGEKFDLVVQKATELGVIRIVPVITKHADIRLRDESDAAKRVTRWQRIAMEAAKQSGRAVVPEVAGAVTFASLIQSAGKDEGGTCLMFSERDGEPLLRTTELIAPNSKLTALVGSEGGWSDEEIAAARAAAWNVVTLGGRTLRAETAAIAVTALLQHLFGDLI
ncbi:MAG: 16S rRNA (uracil(1498)-N(3))-methyltransferase [Blastocatellia bacterium]|nr:16S rRNA (uracil(1498)-N(3))-methyltransferase [Blastocatellia bacterium]